MDRILELTARLTDAANPLSDDELTELRTLCVEQARTLAGTPITAEVAEQVKSLRTTHDAVTAELTSRGEAQAALEAEVNTAMEGLTLPDAEPAAVEPTEPAAETVEPVTAEVPDPAAPAAVDAELEPVAASAAPARPTPRAAAAFIPSSRKPAPTGDADAPGQVRTRLVASSEVPNFAQGSEIKSLAELGEAVTERLRTMHKGRAVVASILTDYPEERDLRGLTPTQVSERIEAACGPQALTASGGICAPVAVDYTLPNWATTDRPIKAGLPSFQADRGGLTFVRPSALTTWSDATAVWPETTDAAPGTATKPVHVVVCGDTDTVLVDAIPTRLRFGNMQGRYFPEQVAYNTTQALAQAARDAETNLWDKIIASTTIAHAPQYLGATRDLLAYVDLAAVALRDRGRMSDGQRIRLLIHRLFKDMLRTDLAREIGHAQSAEFNALAVTDAMIGDWLDARGITPIWAADSPTAVTISGVAIVHQGFASQTAGAVVADWPASCAFTMYPEGGFQFLDGGRLDLGIVRDSVLDATNDYETFIEPFESVAFRAVEAVTVVAPIVPNGASAGTVAPAEPAE